ncbi:nuclear transport factor 2 family protein [Rhodococcus sp. NM-2]|uniref:nuclear transport factor 2 family protein n=1 Tax=Rhodococcus sp. NM-2 TaxID=3401174 RepID=UPI003AABFB1D
MVTHTASAIDVLADLIDAFDALDPDRAGALFADDGTFVFPFAPPGFPAKAAGQREILRLLRKMAVFDRIELYDRELHATEDPEIVFATFASRAQLSGRPYANRYICRARIRDGRILEYQEHFGPFALIAAMRARQRLAALAFCALPPRVASWIGKRQGGR